jgi:YcaO-like protein with predicted kinase domain
MTNVMVNSAADLTASAQVGEASPYEPNVDVLCARCGISRLANVTGLDELGISVCVAVRPHSRGLSTAQGKGFDWVQAKMSALMESVESWHAERIRRPLFAGSVMQAEAEGLTVVPPEFFPHRPTRLPLRQSPTQLLEMTRLTTDEHAWLPFDCASTDFTFERTQPPIFMRSSNGLAAGSDWSQACLHALTEVVERHHVQQWWQQQGLFQHAAQLTHSALPAMEALLQRCHHLQLKVLLWDLSADAVFPCFVALLLPDPLGVSAETGLFTGYGCQLDPASAIQSAVLEAVQSRLTLITGSRDDLGYEDYRRCRNAQFMEWLWRQHQQAPALDRSFLCKLESKVSVAESIEQVERFYRQPVYGLELTEPQLAVPVIRIVMPGMQNLGMAARYYLQRQEPLL